MHYCVTGGVAGVAEGKVILVLPALIKKSLWVDCELRKKKRKKRKEKLRKQQKAPHIN